MEICGDETSSSDSVRYGSDEKVEVVSSSHKTSSTFPSDAMYITGLIAKIFKFKVLESLKVCMHKEMGIWKQPKLSIWHMN